MNHTEIFDQLVQKRRSMRAYDESAPFESGAVKRSLRRALLSPNSSNLQLWEFHQVKDPAKRTEMVNLCLNQPAAATAREMVVVVTRLDLWKKRAEWNLQKLKESFRAKGAEVSNTDVAGRKTETEKNLFRRIGSDEEERQVSALEYYGKLIPLIYRGDRLGILGLIKRLYVNLVLARGKAAFRELGYHDRRISSHKSAALAGQTFMLSMTAEGYDTCAMEGIDSKRIRKFLQLPKGAEINMVIACGPGKPEGIYGDRIRVPEEEVLFEH